MIHKVAPAHRVSIFIAGDWLRAEQICRAYCDEIGLCVTVTPTHYIYKDGQEQGVVVGLINYPRFPSEPSAIWDKAERLAMLLKVGLEQGSFTIQDSGRAEFFSWRPQDTGEPA